MPDATEGVSQSNSGETLSEPPCLKGGEGKRPGVAEVMSDSSSLELDTGALMAYLNTEVRLQ